MEYVNKAFLKGRISPDNYGTGPPGVTREQTERVKKLYEPEQGVNTSKMSGTELDEALRKPQE